MSAYWKCVCLADVLRGKVCADCGRSQLEADVAMQPLLVPVDAINHPPHYKAGGIEAIQVIDAFSLGYALGNVVKYVLRAGRKGAALEDLRKARWYLDHEITRREQAVSS